MAAQGDTHNSQNHDLKEFLSVGQCGDLTLLIASAIQAMRDLNTSSFQTQGHKGKDPISPDLLPLYQAAAENFDAWADQILGRIAEVVNSREHSKSQKQSPSPIARPGRRPQGDQPAIFQYPPIKTILLEQSLDSRRPVILHALLLLCLSLERYDARSRTLLQIVSSSLHLDPGILTQLEIQVASALTQASPHLIATEEASKRAEEGRLTKKWKVGLASIAGAVLIGVTGGLAAPLVAAGIGSVLGGIGLGGTVAAGYLGAVASSGAIVGSLFGVYGGMKAGDRMERYAAEVSDFSFIPVRLNKNRLRVSLGITGWLSDTHDIIDPWLILNEDGEQYALRWEVEALLDLGVAIETMIKSYAWKYVKAEIIRRTIFAGLMAALWPIGLLKFAQVLDNPWKIGSTRALKAGEVLADAFVNRAQGERPITLIGFSLGARVIYSCLLSLASRNAFGLIENVYLFGSPVPTSRDDWIRMRSVVSGRLVNVFSTNDLVLAFMYRTTSVQIGVAGLEAVDGVSGVENIDVSEVVAGHSRWRGVMGKILSEYVGAEDIDLDVVRQKMEKEAKEEQQERHAQQEQAQKPHGEDDMETVMKHAGRKLNERRQANRKEGIDLHGLVDASSTATALDM